MPEDKPDPVTPKPPGGNNDKPDNKSLIKSFASAIKTKAQDGTSAIGKTLSSVTSSMTQGLSAMKTNVESIEANTRAVVSDTTEELRGNTATIIENLQAQKEARIKEIEDRKTEKVKEGRNKEDEKVMAGTRSERMIEGFKNTSAKMGSAITGAMGGVGDAFSNAFDGSPIAKALSGVVGTAFTTLKESRKKKKDDDTKSARQAKVDALQQKRDADDLAAATKIGEGVEGLGDKYENERVELQGALGGKIDLSNEHLEAIKGEDGVQSQDLPSSDGGGGGEDGGGEEEPPVSSSEEFSGLPNTLNEISNTLSEMLGRMPTDAEKEEAKLDSVDMDEVELEDPADAGKKEGMLGGILGGMGRGIGSLGRGIKKLGKGIGGAIKGVLTGIAHGIMAFANPLVLVGAIAMGLAIGAILITLGAVAKILKAMNVDFTPLQELFATFSPLIESFGVAVREIIKPITDLAGFIIEVLIKSLIPLEPLILALAEAFKFTLKILQPIILEAVKFLTVAAPLIDSIIGSITAFGTVFLNTISTVLTTIKDLILGTIEGVVGGIERFAALDGSNLMSVGAGMLSISAGLAAFGVGGALAGVGGAIGELFGGDPIEKFKRFGEIAEPLEKAGMGAFALGQGIKALASVNLNKLGKQIGPFVDAIKTPLQELSEIEFSTAQANVITELLATLGAEGKDALASAKAQAGAVVNQQVNNNMAQSTTSPVFPRTKTIDSPPEMWASRADF